MAFDPELTQGARNAVRVCLRVLAFGKVTVITDEVSLEIAAALVHELEEVAGRYQTWVLEGHRDASSDGFAARDRRGSGDKPGQHFCGDGADQRTEVAHADDRHREPEQYPARAHGQHQEAHHAGRHARGLPEGRPLEREGDGEGERGQAIRAKTPAGTDLVADLNPNYRWVKTSGIISTAKSGNLPGGEVFTNAGDVNGTFVIDGVVGDYLCEKFGDLKAIR